MLIGIFIGGVIPFYLASLTMDAVGKAAFEMINEIRRQFREIPGLLEGKAEPDTERCVDIATSAALRKMILPGVIAVAAPWVVGFGNQRRGAGRDAGRRAARLRAPRAHHGQCRRRVGQRQEVRREGPPRAARARTPTTRRWWATPSAIRFKDTSGPSMNILINVMAIVSLVIAPLLT